MKIKVQMSHNDIERFHEKHFHYSAYQRLIETLLRACVDFEEEEALKVKEMLQYYLTQFEVICGEFELIKKELTWKYWDETLSKTYNYEIDYWSGVITYEYD